MEILSSFIMVFLILVIPVAFAGTKHYWVAIVAYLLFAFVAMAGMFDLTLGFCLASIAFLVVLRQCRIPPKWVIRILCVWTLALPTAGLLSGAREHRELQARYPIELLSERLAYEHPRAASEAAKDSASFGLDDEGAPPRASVQDHDDLQRAHRRRAALEQFHSLTFSQFVSAFGFGANRMTEIQRHFIDYEPPDTAAEPFPNRPQEIESPKSIERPWAPHKLAAGPVGGPRLNQLSVVEQFTSSLSWAYVPSRQNAAGFQPHAILRVPGLHGNECDQWQISRLDLVSLLKFDSPRVYLSEHLPRMEALRNAETRPVDEFEERSLPQLHDGEDIVVDQQLNTIRMMGAVRAAKQCLDCHSVRRGELLGAFSYLLDRKQPLPPPKVESKPASNNFPFGLIQIERPQ